MPPTTLTQIKKRSGEIVSFDPAKIQRAILGAYLEVFGKSDSLIIEQVTSTVIEALNADFQERVPTVEEVQNYVEKALMQANLFDVAKAYIIYRYEHAKERTEKKLETLRKIEEEGIKVKKRDGNLELFRAEKLKNSLEKSLGDIAPKVDTEIVVKQVQLEMYENIETKELERLSIMVLRSFIEKDPAYSQAAARLQTAAINKQLIGHGEIDFADVDSQLKNIFPQKIHKAVAAGKLDPRLLTFDLEKIAAELNFGRDSLHNYLSVQTLLDRYLLKDDTSKELFENIQFFWMRVAMGLSILEKHKTERAIQFYHMMSSLDYVPSSPTLFHSGTNKPQLSSCFLMTVPDDLHAIFKSYSDNAQLLKYAGGTAIDWTPVRGTGALIKATGVESQGVIPFLKTANDVTISINRSGRRRGASCVYLENWHWDIEAFLELRKNTGDERVRTHDLNTAVWVSDLFMQRVRDNAAWSLFSPDETPELHDLYGKDFKTRYEQYEAKGLSGELKLFKQMPAQDLWKKMLNMLFSTSHPWITFKDPSNIRSPQDHVGVVHSSNLCTEITLNTTADETAVCNLGSINLGNHLKDGKLYMEKLEYTTTLAMRMLDNVIDLNFYPTAETKKSNLRHRPVGLGVMGFQDMLFQMGVNFDSEQMVDLADETMEAVSYYAILASSKLAEERGAYSTFRGSKWDRGILPVDTLDILESERGEKIDIPRQGKLDWSQVRESISKHGMRNSNCMAIAPTATISNIANTMPSIEPIYKNIYVKANISGDFVVVNEYLVEALKRAGLWNEQILQKIKFHDGKLTEIDEIPQMLKDRFKETFEIDAKWLIRAAARRGKWIDQSQSLNIFYGGQSGKEIAEIYSYAWNLGLKTTYYLRTLAASQVEKSTVSTNEFGATHIRKTADKAPQFAAQTMPEPVPIGVPAAEPAKIFAASQSPTAVTNLINNASLQGDTKTVPASEQSTIFNLHSSINDYQSTISDPQSAIPVSHPQSRPLSDNFELSRQISEQTRNSSTSQPATVSTIFDALEQAYSQKEQLPLENTVNNSGALSVAQASDDSTQTQTTYKMCRIDDPTCESCQ